MANQRKPFEKICENTPNYSLPRELIMMLDMESSKDNIRPSTLLRDILYIHFDVPEDITEKYYTYLEEKECQEHSGQKRIKDYIGDAVIDLCKKGQ